MPTARARAARQVVVQFLTAKGAKVSQVRCYLNGVSVALAERYGAYGVTRLWISAERLSEMERVAIGLPAKNEVQVSGPVARGQR